MLSGLGLRRSPVLRFGLAFWGVLKLDGSKCFRLGLPVLQGANGIQQNTKLQMMLETFRILAKSADKMGVHYGRTSP